MITPTKRDYGFSFLLFIAEMIAVITLWALLITGCVSKKVYTHDVLSSYKKGLKVGRVIGRDQILCSLTSPHCFKQDVNVLMNPSKYDTEESK